MIEAATQQPKRKISPEKNREYRLRAEALHPEKIEARIRCREAIKRGELVRQPCEKCGNTAEAHHDDYSKPLEVRWFCTKHHAEHHAEQRRLHGIRISRPMPLKWTTHCSRGHVLTSDNVKLGRDGHRRCWACKQYTRRTPKALRQSTVNSQMGE